MAGIDLVAGDLTQQAADTDEIAGEINAGVTFGAIAGSAAAAMPSSKSSRAESAAIEALSTRTTELVDALTSDAEAMRLGEFGLNSTDESGAASLSVPSQHSAPTQETGASPW